MIRTTEHKETYKERLLYATVPEGSLVPDNMRYRKCKDAIGAAIRLSEKKNKKYWVLEVMECISAVWESERGEPDGENS